MSLKLAFERLQNRLESLSDELEELRFNAVDFFPPGHSDQKTNGDEEERRPPSPVETLGESAIALKGDLPEAFVALEKGVAAIHPPRDLCQAQAALVDVNRYLDEALDRFRNEVTEPRSLQNLTDMAGHLGGEWSQWLAQINSIISTIRDKFLETWRALCQCWEELADKLSSAAVSVRTTNIGQQITAPEPRETVLEGMT